jgi:2-dehydropantoate 2-reductase
MDGAKSERVETLKRLCIEAGIEAEVSPDIRAVLWNKFAFICAEAGMTAAVRLPIGAIRENPESRSMMLAIVAEVCELAAAEGVELPPGAVDRHSAFIDSFEAGAYSSLHYDMTHGKPMELEALHGTVVRMAGEHGLPVPMSRAVYSILRPWAVLNQR